MTTAHKNSMRGLTVFITDIRNTPSREEEEKRVNKEMAKIRKKFKELKDVDGYDRRKYVSKLLYMYLLGYDLDFGYMEAVNLLSSLKFQEKLIGYIAVSLLLHENHSMIPLLIQSLQNDLQSRNEYHQSLALVAIGNIGGKEMAESVAPVVQKMLISKSTRSSIKKKSALCLLRLVRKYPDLMTAESWSEKIQTLLDEHDLGLLTSIMGLLLGLVTINPVGYEPCVKKAIWILTKILINRDYTKDYVYYNMANPWLQVKLLRFLQFYPPCDDKAARQRLNEILKKILASADVAKGQSVNHKNALNAVLFEAIDLIIHLDDDRELIHQSASLLGRFISAKETNIRYLALEAMEHLAGLDNETASLVKKHQETVILALKDPDISIRKRALDLLYGLCDRNNSKAIVSELLQYLATADFAIREELVLKIAILAEKFAHHYSWYVDVILQLISLAGDFVSDAIWYRVVQIVTNHEDIQEYAAKTVFEALKQPSCHETAVKVGGYILGEFGHLIAEQGGSGPKAQFELLQSKFPTCTNATKELAQAIRDVFKTYQVSMDAELQQRACEYLRLSHASEDLLSTVWDVMPAFPERENRLSSLLDSSASNDANKDLKDSSATNSRPSSSASSSANTSSSIIDFSDTVTESRPPVSRDPMKDLADVLSSSGHLSNSSGNVTGLQMVSPFERAEPSTNSSDNLNMNSADKKGASLSEDAINDFFKKACLQGEAVLYQDELIRIGFKSEWSRGVGRMMLYYVNLTNQQLTGFRTFVPSGGAVTVNLQQTAPVIEPRGQMQQLAQIACSSPYADPPVIQIGFVYNGKSVSLNLKLPIVIARFMEPWDLNGPEFFNYWKQVPQNAPLEQQAVVKATNSIDLATVSKNLVALLHVAILKGVDPNVNNLVAAGTFTSQSGQIFCLIRIESNPNAMMYRLTLRTPSPPISTALKDLLVIFLQQQ